MAYSSKFARENPKVLDEIVAQSDEKDKMWIQNHINMMKNKVYPFDEFKWINRFQISYAYIALWYYLEGYGRSCIWCRTKINSYKHAYRFHTWRNAVPMILYALMVPLSNIAEYSAQENGKFAHRKTNIVITTRGFITILTIFVIIQVQSFAKSFEKILPFLKLNIILRSFCLLHTFYNVVGAIIRVSQPTVDPYSQYETYLLLFVWIFSCLFAFLTILQWKTLSSSLIEIHEEKFLIYPLKSEKELKADKDDKEKGMFNVNYANIFL